MKVFLKIIIFCDSIFSTMCSSILLSGENNISSGKLPENYTYNFEGNAEEIPIVTKDNKRLSSVLFRVPDSKGVIFTFMVMVAQ